MATKIIGIDTFYSLGPLELPFNEKSGFKPGNKVIFKDSDGREEYGIVRYVDEKALDEKGVLVDSKVLRKATANDIQKMESNIERGEHALELCRGFVKEFDLDMVVFKAVYSFDGSKAYFTFTAEERVDFRELVKSLAGSLKKQIYLRQIGPRDKARFVGGYGRCGRPLCCSTFLGKLESINMEMVRDQGLEGKGSSKLSGACGKLLCCLKYEVEAYHELRKALPNIGDVVSFKRKADLPDKQGRVVAIDILNQKVRAALGGGESLAVGADDIDKVVVAAVQYNS